MRRRLLLAFGLAAFSATGVCVAADAVRLPVTPFATLPSDARHPESLDVDPATGEVYVGTFDARMPESARNNQVLRFAADGRLLAQRHFGPTPLTGVAFHEGDLGLWNGRRMGYKEIASGNIRDCLYSDTDYSTWYVDRLGDLRCDAIHHDGTNHYLYRTYKPGVRQSQIDHLKEKLYFGTATRADITRITRRLGDDIAKVYGFSIPRQRQAQAAER